MLRFMDICQIRNAKNIMNTVQVTNDCEWITKRYNYNTLGIMDLLQQQTTLLHFFFISIITDITPEKYRNIKDYKKERDREDYLSFFQIIDKRIVSLSK